MTAVRRIGQIRAHIVHALARPAHAPVRPARVPAEAAPSSGSPAQRWQLGHDAFIRGDLPPADSDAAEGWYWAENQASRR